MNENTEALRWDMGDDDLYPDPNGIWVLYED
jgi:hypothetical protein